MKWLSITLALLGLAQFALAGDVFVLVKYDGRGQAYDLLDDGWAVVEAHPSFCLILCSEEQAGAVPGGRIIADDYETLYVIWNPGNRQLPEIVGTRIIEVPGKAQILVARAGDAMEYAMAGAELKRVNKTPIRKPVDAPPLRTYDDKVPFGDLLIFEMIDKITPERYQEIVETLSVGVTPTRFTPSIYFEAATDYVQTTFHDIPDLDVQVWYYDGEADPSEMYWSGKFDGWISGEGCVWRTDDGGWKWTPYDANGDALDVVFTDANTGFICGEDGYLAKTEDGGLTWIGSDISGYDVDLNSISFADPMNGITGGSDGFYCVTDDGGDTWEKGRIPGGIDITDVFYHDDLIWAGCSTYDFSRLYRSTDRGETWDELSDNFPDIPHLTRIWFHNPNNGVVIGENEIYYTEDGGYTWTEATGEYGTSNRDVFFLNDKTGWKCGHSPICRTDDGGKSWVRCEDSPGAIYAVFFVSEEEGWAVQHDSDLYYSADGGNTWKMTDPEFFYPTWENVIAEIEGTVSPDEVIIICGHYDSKSEDPYHLAPGAEDNASGSGGVIAAAEAMAGYEYESTVRFIAFSGEEEGLVGSTAYAEAMAEKGENIVAVLNMDMVAYLDEPVYDIKVEYNEPSTDLLEAIIDAGAVYTPSLDICPELYEPRGSDHMPFWDNGYRAVEII
ncbi:MAG: M28 family peptidase [Candidatus Coatesbacteria bacterium]|nr:MAG: M28 family peptidase [Candidatus Coatesbacteria bacterium]